MIRDSKQAGKHVGLLILRVLTDRLVFNPAFLALTLYVLGRLQGETHKDTTQFIRSDLGLSSNSNG